MQSFSYTHNYPKSVGSGPSLVLMVSTLGLMFAIGLGLGVAFGPSTATASRPVAVEARMGDSAALQALVEGIGEIKSTLAEMSAKADAAEKSRRRTAVPGKPGPTVPSEEATASLKVLEALNGRIERLSEVVLLMNHQLAQPIKTHEMLQRQEREPAGAAKPTP